MASRVSEVGAKKPARAAVASEMTRTPTSSREVAHVESIAGIAPRRIDFGDGSIDNLVPTPVAILPIDRIAQRSALTVSMPGDPLEVAADRAADRALRSLGGEVNVRASAPLVQREATAPVAGHADSAVVMSRIGAGHPLDGLTRARMEVAFGSRFDGVRIHDDASAAATSRLLDARAFTLGPHIAFAAGAYRPGTSSGDHLLAHELAHTIQQRGVAPLVARTPASVPAPRADPLWPEIARIEERELEEAKLTTQGSPTPDNIQTLTARLARDDLKPDAALLAAAHLDARVFAVITDRPRMRTLLATRLEMFVQLYSGLVGKLYAPGQGTPILAEARAFLDAHSAEYVAFIAHQTLPALVGELATPAYMNEPVLTINNVPAVRRGEVTPERIEQIKRDAAIDLLLAPARGAAELGKRLEWLEALVGYPIGVLEGAGEAARDLGGAALDNVKEALSFVGSLLTVTFLEKMLELAEKLWHFITSLPHLAGVLGQWFAEKWSDASYYGKGKLIGEIVGYIALSVAIGILTDGASLEAEGSELEQAAMRLLKIVDKAANPMTFLAPILRPAARLPGVAQTIAAAAKVTSKAASMTAPARRWISELPSRAWRGLGRTSRIGEDTLDTAAGLVDRRQFPWRDGDAAVVDSEHVTQTGYDLDAGMTSEPIDGPAMDSERFGKMKRAFERQGGVVAQDAEAQAYLEARDASAVTLNDKTMVLRPQPTASETFEEFIHTAQYRTGRATGANVTEMEIEAAEKLIRNRRQYGISPEETRQTIARLRRLREIFAKEQALR